MSKPALNVERRVWKYKLGDVTGVNDVIMPQAAELVLFDMQGGDFHAWFEVEPDSPTVERRFIIVGTGHTVPIESVHRGSLQQGAFVWHLYEGRHA